MTDDFSYDAFLSHSSKDKAFVGAIAERLRADNLRIWFDEWELKPVDSIGLLSASTPRAEYDALAEALRQGLRDLGYVEGQNLVLEVRYAGGSQERLRDLAAELARLPVEVMVAPGAATIRTAQQATRTVPIVMVGSYDPVVEGFVASLARPGGEHHGLELPSSGAPAEATGVPEGGGAPQHTDRRLVEPARTRL